MPSAHLPFFTGQLIFGALALAEMLLYFSCAGGYASLICRLRFKLEIVPTPGLTFDDLEALPRETANARLRFDRAGRRIIARRLHPFGSKRGAAVVQMRLREGRDGLIPEIRWGYVPAVMGACLPLLGFSVIHQLSDAPMSAVLGLGAFTLLINGIWYLFGRASAALILGELEMALLDLER